MPRLLTRFSYYFVKMPLPRSIVAKYERPAADILITTRNIYAQVLSGHGLDSASHIPHIEAE